MLGNLFRATWLAGGVRIGIPVFVTPKPAVVLRQQATHSLEEN